MGTEPVYTAQAVADRYEVPLSTVYRWASDRTVTSLKVGKHLRFRESDLREFEAKAARPARA